MPRRDREAYNEYMKDYMLKRYHERREYIYSVLGRECKVCGKTDDLEVDHINAKDKSFYISKLWSIKWDLFIKEVNKCQVLCNEHHIQKSKECGDYKKTTTPL